MRRLVLIFPFVFLLLCNRPCTAQFNYVPNPSFEEYDSVALLNGDSTFYKWVFYPTYWFLPVNCGYLNYYNSKLNYLDSLLALYGDYMVPQNPWSYTYPYDGTAMSGFTPFQICGTEGARNYSETGLLHPLQAGHTYCVRFHMILMDSCTLAIDQIGAFFSLDSLTNEALFSCYLLQNPQVVGAEWDYYETKKRWYEVTGSFTAMGGEKFITIGNFKTDSSTHYIWEPSGSSHYYPGAAYHLDMVSVIECDSNITEAYAGSDTSLCIGDSVSLGVQDTTDGYSFEWVPAVGLSDSTVSNPLAAPSQTTTYVLQQWYYNSFLRTDTVTVNVLDCNPPPPDTSSVFNNVVFIPNIFSPNSDGQNDYFVLHAKNIQAMNLTIYNRWGLCVFSGNAVDAAWDGKYKDRDCPEGVYFYVVEIGFESGESLVKRGNVTLIR